MGKRISISGVLIIVALALFQTAIFGSLIYIFERLGLFCLVVSSYNSNLFYAAELGIVFFILFLITDILAELFRFTIKNQVISIVILSLFVSFFQLVVLFLLLIVTDVLNIITISVIIQSSSFEWFLFLALFIPLFIAEISINLFRRLFKVEVK